MLLKKKASKVKASKQALNCTPIRPENHMGKVNKLASKVPRVIKDKRRFRRLKREQCGILGEGQGKIAPKEVFKLTGNFQGGRIVLGPAKRKTASNKAARRTWIARIDPETESIG